jgi:hypothetical protein
LTQQLSSGSVGALVLVEDVEESLKVAWLIPAPAANAKIINNGLIVMALFSLNSFVNGRLFKYAAEPTPRYHP